MTTIARPLEHPNYARGVLSASIIVPTYNRPDALLRTLDALSALDYPPERREVIVVDSGRTPGIEALAVARGARYARHPDLGVSAARNHGARLAGGELLLFVDDDIIVARDNLGRHEAIHARDARCLVSGHWEFDPALRVRLEGTALGRYRLAYEDRYNRPHGVTAESERGQVHPLTLASANLSVRRDGFWSLEGFDERFPVAAEDQDLTWRARRAGFTLVYDYDIRVLHNDQHPDLAALCRRQERAAIGIAYFVGKNPDAPPVPMLDLNSRLSAGDPPRVIVRKLTRALLSRRASLGLAHRLVGVVERVRPNGGWPLEFLYGALGGLYVFRGVRRGLRLTSGTTWPAAHHERSA
jgi:glycosyltransferase involved in cell wall biosynthesis